MLLDKILAVCSCSLLIVVGLLCAAYFREDAPNIALICVFGGFILGGLSLIVIMGYKSKGKVSIDLRKQKGELEWSVRQKEPLDTISSATPTDTTRSDEAIDLCQKGRAILNDVGNVAQAYDYFTKAASLDDNYWEPKANMAGIHVIKGELKQAYDLANEVRDTAIATNNNLAFSNASLIMASAMETNIDPLMPADKKKREYEKIVAKLEEALNRSPHDVVVRSAKIKAKIIGGFAKEDIDNEISRCLADEKFVEEFVTVLNSDEELKSTFCDEYSEIAHRFFPPEQK